MLVVNEMGDNAKLIKIIDDKEKQLYRAEQEMSAWNNGKYKTSTSAMASNILVKSLRDEIKKLHQELKI